jgi:hypothetical protein
VIRIVLIQRGKETDCGTYPREQAQAFWKWVRAYCPNRHYALREVVA